MILLLSGCPAQILGIPGEDAALMLANGDLDFIRAGLPESFPRARSSLSELHRIHPGAAFYAGLLVSQNSPADRELELLLFLAALESPSLPVRREAAKILIPMILLSHNGSMGDDVLRHIPAILRERSLRRAEGITSLEAAYYYSIGRYDNVIRLLQNSDRDYFAHEWDMGIYHFALHKRDPSMANNTEFTDELITLLFGSTNIQFLQWALAELNSEALSPLREIIPMEIAALSVRLRPEDYRAASLILRQLLADGGIFFFRYPDFLGDLGRAYQYTPAVIREGAELFGLWSQMLDSRPDMPDTATPSAPEQNTGENLRLFINSMDEESLDYGKFMVNFYMGRITRTIGNLTESNAYFYKSLPFAPNALQSDAVLWYILMNTLATDAEAAVRIALDTLENWDNIDTFAAILDRISSYLARTRQWERIAAFYPLLERHQNPGGSLAQFAYIMGRMIEEGFIQSDRESEEFFRIALHQGGIAFYYRAASALKLGEILIPEADFSISASPASGSEAEFLLGFYEYGAASLARPYINAAENELQIPELRLISQAMAGAGRMQESMNFTSRYTRRAGYAINVQDLHLHYPLAFEEIIERRANEFGLMPPLMFGLIHTESHFMANAVSRVGALGLSQLMNATAEDMAGRIFRQGGPDYRGGNFSDPEINVHIGTFYLRHLIDLMGHPMHGLLAYNGGQGRVRRWQSEDNALGALPADLFLETVEFPETREYGRRVLAAAALYGYLYYDIGMAETAAALLED